MAGVTLDYFLTWVLGPTTVVVVVLGGFCSWLFRARVGPQQRRRYG
jgi:hypothetical protein